VASNGKTQNVTIGTEAARGGETGNTLLPMLIAGLVLIVLGGIAVMAFV
jgi:hypothetical protein